MHLHTGKFVIVVLSDKLQGGRCFRYLIINLNIFFIITFI